ncbi:hypothetical protein G6F57_005520 [Rhizopus arrhizus]|uniref:Uncharacterized protein n=1 Tax=Rhizopus oryzae TaxID=64495 RepID=A0A9P6XJE1_RHIOR|nr:hypothetical protein G6F24_012264 [Rhizopus arrhizus]KAG0780735.1 hypothetical protein G6F21_011993 [Rhizopus arrhizus]KAG0782786.1 hypothetical protein G6F22_008951 [Rhizopus arrhizus]KAG0831394.1 hypothetical protein G6F19_006760 [Rhizopus arrhizus]KAG0854769.1 hypothetical protein G6F17_006063 [Rhizopus arrhizus]
MQSISECEQILTETLDKAHYKVSVSCGRLLYTIARIALSRQTHNPNAMDVDTPVVLQIRQMVTVVIEIISKVEIGLEHSKKNTDQVYLGRIQELLKIKAQCCTLLSDWDFDSSFQVAYNLLTRGNDETAAVLLPYLSFLLQKCRELPRWFPENAIQELKKRMNRSFVFINLMKLLLRTTPSSNELTSKIVSLLREYGSWNNTNETFTSNCWNLYVIGLEAGCSGWYELMYTIIKDLQKKVGLF